MSILPACIIYIGQKSVLDYLESMLWMIVSCWELNLGPWEEQSVLLTEPLLALL